MLALLGFVVGAFGTLIGAGGGVILTPVLLLLYRGDSAQTITSISLFVVFFNAGSGSIAYARQHRIDYRSGFAFAAAALPGAVLGVFAVTLVDRRLFDLIMGLVLLAVAAWLILGHVRERRGPPAGRLSDREIKDTSGNVYRFQVPVRRGALYSVGVGFISSFCGIGGGIIHVPLMVTALGFPMHVATATSHFVLAQMSFVATGTHAFQGSYDNAEVLGISIALAAGVVVGAQVGARISSHVSDFVIKVLLAIALVSLSARLIWSAIEA